jgi:hypothetical protein
MSALGTVVGALVFIWLVSLTGIPIGVLIAVALVALCVAGFVFGPNVEK